MDVPTVTLTDEAGRSLVCSVEHSLELVDQEYALLLPIDTPIEIFTWRNDEDEEPILVEDESEIDRIFDTAKAVLAEHNLVLKRSAVALTAEGEIPELDSDEVEVGNGTAASADEGVEYEELQLLASFYHEEQEYTIYAPLDPLLILARVGSDGQPHLLSKEELQQLEPMLPMLEDKLFDALG